MDCATSVTIIYLHVHLHEGKMYMERFWANKTSTQETWPNATFSNTLLI